MHHGGYVGLCTTVGMYPGIMVGVLYPGIMVGVLYPTMPPWYPGGHTTLPTMPPYYTLGTPWSTPTPVSARLLTLGAGCVPLTVLWAQGRRVTLGERKGCPPEPQECEERYTPLRIILCSPREEQMERSDITRVILGKSPMVRVLCAEWCPFPASDR